STPTGSQRRFQLQSRIQCNKINRSSARRQLTRGGVRRGRIGTNSKMDKANRLAGPEGVSKTGPPIENGNLQWPPEINEAFAISIRDIRWQGMQARLGKWASKVQLFPGTNGGLFN